MHVIHLRHFISELCVRRNIRSKVQRKPDLMTGRVRCQIRIKLQHRSKLSEETKNSGWKKHRCNFCDKLINTKILIDKHTYVCAKKHRTRMGLRKRSINSNRTESTNHKYKLRKFVKSTNSNDRNKQQTSDNGDNDDETTESGRSSDEQESTRSLRSKYTNVSGSSRFNTNVLRRGSDRSGASDTRGNKKCSQTYMECKMCSKKFTSRILLVKHAFFCVKVRERRKRLRTDLSDASLSLNASHKYALRDRSSLSGLTSRKIAVKIKDRTQNEQSNGEQSSEENKITWPETKSTSKKKRASQCKDENKVSLPETKSTSKNKRTFQCKKCSKEFSTKILLLKHARFCAKSRPPKKVLGSKGTRNGTETNRCKCTLRKRRYTDDDKRTVRHRNKRHDTSERIESDENERDSDQSFSCILCARTFTTKRSLIEHVRFCLTAVNRKNTLRVRSSDSEQNPKKKASLRKSRNVVSSGIKFNNNNNNNEDQNDENPDRKNLLEKKTRNKEKKSAISFQTKTFQCKMCERVFHSKLLLVRHVRFSRQCVQAVERRKSLRGRILSKTNLTTNPRSKDASSKRRVSSNTKENHDNDDDDEKEDVSSVRCSANDKIENDEVRIDNNVGGNSDEEMMFKHKMVCSQEKKSEKSLKRKRLNDDKLTVSDANYKFKLRRSTILSNSRGADNPFSDEDIPMPDITSDNANKSPERIYWDSDDSGDSMPDITRDTAESMDKMNKNCEDSEVHEREDSKCGDSEILSEIAEASEVLCKIVDNDVVDIEQDENRQKSEQPELVCNAATVSDGEEETQHDVETSDVVMKMEIFRCNSCSNLYATKFMFDNHAEACTKKQETEHNSEDEVISIAYSDSESEVENDQDDVLKDVQGNGDDFISESDDEGSLEIDSEDSLLDESDVEIEIFICKLCNKMFDAEANLDSHLKRCKKAKTVMGVTVPTAEENQDQIPQFVENGEENAEDKQKEKHGGPVVTLTHNRKGLVEYQKDEFLPNQTDESKRTQNGLTIGLETNEPEKVQNNLCEKIGKFTREGKNDLRSSRKQGIYLCETCDKQFNVKSNFEAHRVPCKDRSRKSFSRKPTIFDEIREAPPQCQFCHKWFSAEFLLVKHLLEFHAVRKCLPVAPFVTFECLTCKALFSTLNEFSCHQCNEETNSEVQRNSDDSNNKSRENHGNSNTTHSSDVNNNVQIHNSIDQQDGISKKENAFEYSDGEAEEEEFPTVTSQVETPHSGILTGTAQFRRCDICFQTFDNEKQCQTHSCLCAKPL